MCGRWALRQRASRPGQVLIIHEHDTENSGSKQGPRRAVAAQSDRASPVTPRPGLISSWTSAEGGDALRSELRGLAMIDGRLGARWIVRA